MATDTLTTDPAPIAPTTPRKRGRPPGSNATGTILKGAAAAFATHGYSACRIEDILQSAGISRTHFYRYFSNKDEVYRKLVERQLDYAQRRLRGVSKDFSPDMPPGERMNRIIEMDVEIALESGPFLTVMMRDMAQNEKHRDLWREKSRFFCALLSDLIVESGYSRPDPLLLGGIVSAIEHILVGLSEEDLELDAKRQRGVALIAQLLSSLMVMEPAQ